jgi:hypothetical protein
MSQLPSPKKSDTSSMPENSQSPDVIIAFIESFVGSATVMYGAVLVRKWLPSAAALPVDDRETINPTIAIAERIAVTLSVFMAKA